MIYSLSRLKRQPQNENELKNGDNLKNEDDLKMKFQTGDHWRIFLLDEILQFCYFFTCLSPLLLKIWLSQFIDKTYLHTHWSSITSAISTFSSDPACCCWCFCPALTKLALDPHVNFCLYICLCVYLFVFPVFFSMRLIGSYTGFWQWFWQPTYPTRCLELGWAVPHSDFLAWLSSATLKNFISGVLSRILMR